MSITPRWAQGLLAASMALAASPALAAPDVGQMFANFSDSATSIMRLVVWAGWLLGIIIGAKALLSLKEYSESGGRTQLKTPIGLFLIGACLVAIPGTISVATETMSLGQNTALEVFSDGGGTGGGVPGMDAAIRGVLLFVKLIGHIAFVRGFLILKRLAEGQQGAEMGRGVAHILGGAAAINITETIRILANTVGMPLPL